MTSEKGVGNLPCKMTTTVFAKSLAPFLFRPCITDGLNLLKNLTISAIVSIRHNLFCLREKFFGEQVTQLTARKPRPPFCNVYGRGGGVDFPDFTQEKMGKVRSDLLSVLFGSDGEWSRHDWSIPEIVDTSETRENAQGGVNVSAKILAHRVGRGKANGGTVQRR